MIHYTLSMNVPIKTAKSKANGSNLYTLSKLPSISPLVNGTTSSEGINCASLLRFPMEDLFKKIADLQMTYSGKFSLTEMDKSLKIKLEESCIIMI
jgi:hypothetical protein